MILLYGNYHLKIYIYNFFFKLLVLDMVFLFTVLSKKSMKVHYYNGTSHHSMCINKLYAKLLKRRK